ncbi:phospholipid-translocating P-type ATPase, flippase [Spizellomyces punctatus DAOM BR117]|uniref:Phospholipid-transporting ATPase n=1 Tax=Spizellomyces punctatus (strain DAOM BR117) TaxID=645134 RepID=A0A0L0HA09_SPIPD|nr:phospholipid-translocating P-type ATPase, flippase [Spizellomyces punctatus DAOM BR117]KNC97846.1 phospholipid-translocating P-type ATPase, flippase [Spizellomyces punctatus DAOM BR117]|eukprot:XP_016605886.1 phospholipid-translocating P-type ATPase, flippase [Spizellomyces punctatus DAOM BR117]
MSQKPSAVHQPRLIVANLLRALGFPVPSAAPPQPPPPKPKRRIYVNIPLPPVECDHLGRPHQHWTGNKVRTSKYTPLTFVPKNLAEQFRRLANVYFLMTVILQIFPMFGVASPILAAMPLIVILTVTGIKDGFEDWKRHKTDNMVNNSMTWTLKGNWKNVNRPQAKKSWLNFGRRVAPCECGPGTEDPLCANCAKKAKPKIIPTFDFQPSNGRASLTTIEPPEEMTQGWARTPWKDLHVGDFVLLTSDNRIPADILILSTSDSHGVCFVETKGLDGETNLKSREALKETLFIKTAADCHTGQFIIESEAPNMNLYSYSGALVIPPPCATLKPVHAQRRLSHKPSMINALDLFDGSRSVPINIQNILLRGSILRNSAWVIGVVLSTGIDTKVLLNAGYTPSKRSRIERLMNPQVAMNFAILLVMCVICAGMVTAIMNGWLKDKPPWVTAGHDNARVSGFFTFWASMIMLQNVVPISLYITIEGVKTIQAYFIYSDIDIYHEETDDPCVPKSWNIADDLGQIEYLFSDKTGTLTQNKMEFMRCSIAGVPYGQGYTDVTADREGLDPSSRAQKMSEMSLEMRKTTSAIYKNPHVEPDTPLSFVDPNIWSDYNTVDGRSVIRNFFTLLALCHTVLPPKRTNNSVIEYAAQSPDEQALVTGAKNCGFTFLDRKLDEVTIDVLGEIRKYRVLNILEFTSSRKRMSVIVKDERDGKIWLLCKGADSVIYERLAPGQSIMCEQTLVHLELFANEGLRTLCLAQRVIPESEYISWAERYHKAACTLVDREREMEMVGEEIEKELELLGATAIEDKLQEQVPECIALLRQAGIKVWVLTGDKLETAINISLASNLLTSNQTLIVLKAHTPQTIFSQLRETLAEHSANTNVALIIDGDSLRHALSKPEGQDLLLRLCMICQSVVCCRVSPKQKAQVVRLVKRGVGAMCASIGDGANDVSMIQEAHVGIGISGQEGLQAAMAADYVIAQFKFLSKLLLVHGHWSYYRVAETVMNFFYKNLVWVFSLFWYQFFSGFSAEILFDYTYLMFFNLLFTSLPTLILGVFDQDISAPYALSIPQLYERGIRQELFTTRRFLLTVFDALYQSSVCFFFAYALTVESTWDSSGYGVDKRAMGTMVAMSAIITVNLGVGMNIRNWTWLVFVVIFGSTALFVVYVPIWSVLPSSTLKGVVTHAYGNASFWLGVILSVVVCLLPRIVWRLGKSMIDPPDLDLIRERQKYRLGTPPRLVRVHEHAEKEESVQNGTAKIDLEMTEVRRRVSSVRHRPSKVLTNAIPEEPEPGEKEEHPHGDEDEAELVSPYPLSPIYPTVPPTSPTQAEAPATPSPVRSRRPISAPIPRITTSGLPRANHADRSLSAFITPEPHHTSLIFMDSRTTSRNTGYAFSFDEGVVSRDVVGAFSTSGLCEMRDKDEEDDTEDEEIPKILSGRKACASDGELWKETRR